MLKGTWFGRIIVFILVLFTLLPILWLVYSAFLPKNAAITGQMVGFSLENFAALPFNELLRPLLLSLVLSSLVAWLQLVIALPAAYAIRSGAKLLSVYLFLLSVPVELLLIPLYGLLQQLHFKDNILSLIVPFLANPFTVFLLYSGISKLPWTFVEAARLDGATNLQIIKKVVTPLLLPELTAAAVLGFAAHWNLVLYPKVMIDNPAWWTVQVALNDLLHKNPNAWGLLGAAATITSLPILIMYIFFESKVTKTLEGGLK